jgi:Heparinase II/III N-terminus/Heparinase II/III-like protein
MRDPSLQPEYFLLDTVVRTQCLITAREGGFQTRPCGEHPTGTGDGAMTGTEVSPTESPAEDADSARFCTPSRLLTLNMRPPTSDLSEFNQFSVSLLNRTSEVLLVGMKLIHASETFRAGSSDVSLSGGREELPPGGWIDLKFPAECFGTYGVPDGWHDIREIELSFSRERTYSGTEPINIEIRSLDGEFREMPPGPRLTPQGLAEGLNPEFPGVKELISEKRAVTAFNTGFWSPGPPFVANDSGLLIPAPHPYPRESADEILQGKVMGQRLGYPFSWDNCPSGVLEWSHFLHRHHFMRELVIALADKSDEQSARELGRLISSWISSNPVPTNSNGGAGPSWETLSVAWRLREWLWIAGIAWSADSFEESAKMAMLRSIWEHARSLMDHKGHPNNWIIVESSALALAGMCFPRFREAKLWLQTGVERLEAEFHKQFFPDGVHFEISPLYHSICLNAMLEVKQSAAARGVPLPGVFDLPLERATDYLAALCRPDFTWPSLNDAGSASSDYTAIIRKARDLFQRSDLEWIGSRGLSGTQPHSLFRTFPNAGIATFRSHYGSDANFLVFRAGPAGAFHVHEDVLSIDVTALGVPRLVDPGITTYAPDKLTEYYRSPDAHNQILIDGKPQDRSALKFGERIREAGPEFSCWSDAFVDVATGICRGPWGGGSDTYVLKRTVVFVKPDYWIIRDVAEGAGKHELSGCWQFYPSRVEVDIKTLAARCVDARGPGFELLPLLGSKRADVEISTGLLGPPRGWVSLNGSDVPGTSCIYRVRTAFPATLIWILLPVAKGPVSGIQAIRHDSDKGEIELEIRLPQVRSDMITLGNESVEIKGLQPG